MHILFNGYCFPTRTAVYTEYAYRYADERNQQKSSFLEFLMFLLAVSLPMREKQPVIGCASLTDKSHVKTGVQLEGHALIFQ